jgi:tRNA(fMet)-specific endonuclease VapC
MTKRYLLDTDTLSHFMNRPDSPVAKKIRLLPDDGICTSIIVACELRFGAFKKSSAALTHRIDQCLNSMEVLALEPGVDRVYGNIRATLESKGQSIGANDLLIAAHAIFAGLVLVTHNTSEFRRIPKLDLEDWLAA